MGTGKTSAAINFMNHNDGPFVFVTPYKEECERIRVACAERNFVVPEEKPTKLINITQLLKRGCNIASTHALFSSYTQEIVDLIRQHGYTLIMDEAYEVISPMDIKPRDMKDLLKRNMIAFDPDTYRVKWLDQDYDGETFSDMKLRAQSGTLLYYCNQFLFWMFPIEVFEAFHNAIVLTYMFDAQNQRYYFQLNHVDYDYIGVRCDTDGVYEFCDISEETPYQMPLRELIEVFDRTKLNQIGTPPAKDADAMRKDGTLSANWMDREKHKRASEAFATIGKNIYNVFHNYYKAAAGTTMWSILADYKDDIDTRRYNNDYVPCTSRATNKYADRKCLAYVRNIFMQPYLANYYRERGCEVDEERYAVAELVQWVWRSAIRNGQPIKIYIPSGRLRTLFLAWIDAVSDGRETRKRNILKEGTIDE